MYLSESPQFTAIVIFAFTGLFFAVLSALEKHVKWITSFCAIFGEGCAKTMRFTLFNIPVALHGVGYYIVLILTLYFMPAGVFWLVMAGFGIELTFIWIMVHIRALCIFCIFNAFVISGLFLFYFEPAQIWESISVILSFFVVSLYLLYRENASEFLKQPELPLTQVEFEDDPATGPPDASVVVVEFSDYLCPACRVAHETANRIKKIYKDRIRWVFKDFPLQQHEGADIMAEAAHCAREQDRFWQYQDMMFSSDGAPDSEKYLKHAESCGLDREKFEQCLKIRKYRTKVENNIENGKKAGVSVTPTFIINEKTVSGSLSEEKFKELIEKALEKTKS